MQEIQADLFSFIENLEKTEEPFVLCITTNGIVGLDGKAIMGAGTAGEAAKRWPAIREVLGLEIKSAGNRPACIGILDNKGKYYKPHGELIFEANFICWIYSFPTKNDFRKPADLELIKSSAEKLVKIADDNGFQKIYIPVPGCGKTTGKLDWEKDVKPIIKDILDDRFIITFLEK